MEVIYCVPEAVFRSLGEAAEARRAARIDDYRRRFAELEELLSQTVPDQTQAEDSLRALRADVVAERLWTESFTSQRTGSTATFASMLEQYSRQLRDTRAYVDRCIEDAKDFTTEGHLAKASRSLDEAASLDRGVRGTYVQRLRGEVEQLRAQRATALGDAERLSSLGRHRAAARRLQDAARIDQDDQDSLERTIRILDSNYQWFLRANPKNSWAFEIGVGSLGVDEALTSSQVDLATGFRIEGGPPVSFKLEYHRALGRHGDVAVAGSWGFSTPDAASSSLVEDQTFFDFVQATLGIGFKSVRRSPRGAVLRLMAGPAWESASLGVVGLEDSSTSDSKLGWFARVSVQWSIVDIFVQQGFGFAESGEMPDSLIGWSDKTQVGVGIVF